MNAQSPLFLFFFLLVTYKIVFVLQKNQSLYTITLHKLWSLIVDIFLYDLMFFKAQCTYSFNIGYWTATLLTWWRARWWFGFGLVSCLCRLLWTSSTIVFQNGTSDEVIHRCHGLQQKNLLCPMEQSQIQVSSFSNNIIEFYQSSTS